jgi:tetratricopeptide (TPR) repeat protein
VLHRALEVDEKSKAAALTWNNLGLVALSRRRDQEAFADFDQAAKLDPQLAVARRNKAAVYLDCGDYARAADELRHLTKADPDDEETWIALGVAERGRGNLDAAARAYGKAIELVPDLPDALYDFGVLEMDFRRDNAKAKQYFEQFLKAAGDTHSKRADATERMGRMK